MGPTAAHAPGMHLRAVGWDLYMPACPGSWAPRSSACCVYAPCLPQALEERPPSALVALQTRLAALYPEYVICHMPADVLSVSCKNAAVRCITATTPLLQHLATRVRMNA
jgi:hypothetical protein